MCIKCIVLTTPLFATLLNVSLEVLFSHMLLLNNTQACFKKYLLKRLSLKYAHLVIKIGPCVDEEILIDHRWDENTLIVLLTIFLEISEKMDKKEARRYEKRVCDSVVSVNILLKLIKKLIKVIVKAVHAY